jgi:hypothetical protein
VAGEAGRVGGIPAKLLINRLQHADQVCVDLIIPESQHLEAGLREIRIASSILPGMRIKVVLTAVQFDNEVLSQTLEINDVFIAWRLPPEMIAARFPRSEVNPQFHLLWCHRFAQLARAGVCHASTPPGWPSASHPPLSGEG